MKDKIQNLLSAIVCLMFVVGSLSAQTYDFATGPGIDPGITPYGTGPLVLVCTNGDPLNNTIIGDGVTIANVTIDLNHTFDGDINLSLIAPDGTTMDLSSGNGVAGNNYSITVFEDGSPSITTGAAPFNGSFEAEGGTFAAVFDGVDASGEWVFEINDTFGGFGAPDLVAASITLIETDAMFCGFDCALDCPDDQIINLEAGECSETVLFDPPTFVPGGDCIEFIPPPPPMMVNAFENILNIPFYFNAFGSTTDFVDNSPISLSFTAEVVNAWPTAELDVTFDGLFTVDWDFTPVPGEAAFDFPVLVYEMNGPGNGFFVVQTGANMAGLGSFSFPVEVGNRLFVGIRSDVSITGSSVTYTNAAITEAATAPAGNAFLIDQTAGPSSGTLVDPDGSPYTITYTASNVLDPSITFECSFDVVVNEYAGTSSKLSYL